jgi:chaperonin GroES
MSTLSDDIRRGNAPRRGPFKGVKVDPNSLNPTGRYVLVLRDSAETKTAGGIIVPDTALERKITGRAFKVGPACEEIKAGDRVMVAKYGAVDFQVVMGDEHYNFMAVDESSICLVIADDVELGEAPL